MIAGLGSIIDRVTGLFGKTYFLAGFFPVLFLAAISLLAGYDSSAWIYREVSGFRALDTGRQALVSGALLVAVAMLGFIYWSANPWWRAILQGSAFRGGLHDWLVRDQLDRLNSLEAEVKRCEDRVFEFRSLYPDQGPVSVPAPAPEPPPPAASCGLRGAVKCVVSAMVGRGEAEPEPPEPQPDPDAASSWMERLAAARQQGEAGGSSGDATAELEQAFAGVRSRIAGRTPLTAEDLDALCVKLESELQATSAAAGSKLDRMHIEFSDLAARARARAENAWIRALSARRIQFPVDLASVGPTRMANVAELYSDYAIKRYQLDPEVFWLHLQRSAAADEKFRPILEEARLKLDVSVAMAMACALGSLWAVAIGVWGHSVPLLLLTGVGLPAAALLFYRATITNLGVYGEAVRATVDLFRFDVLKALRLPLPADSEAERELWEALTLSNQLLGGGKLTYDQA